ncbi:MAG TPA: BMP family ABC transporter substrate-binding protein [Ktedonobacterales bacterium]
MFRTRSRVFALVTTLLLLVPALAACGGTGTSSTKQIKVGLVTDIGGLNDKGFNALAYQGLKDAQTAYPSVKGDVTESKTGDDYIPNLTKYATQGYDLVIGVGFLMQEAVGTVSGQFPNVKFAIIDGAGTDKDGNDLKHSNVYNIFFKEQEAGALVGVIAGDLEKAQLTPKKSNVISAVGGINVPPVVRYIAGYKWAALKVDPTITVQVGYSQDFVDGTKCQSVAKSQIETQKSDIVFQVAGQCGLGALKAAGDAGVYSIGVDTDQKASDKSVIASAFKKVDVATKTAIGDVVNNTFTSGDHLFGLNNGGVGYAPGNITLPANVLADVQTYSDQIKSGSLTVPTAIP